MENGGFGGGVFWGYVWELLFWSLLEKIDFIIASLKMYF
jgi:hypothetical protein